MNIPILLNSRFKAQCEKNYLHMPCVRKLFNVKTVMVVSQDQKSKTGWICLLSLNVGIKHAIFYSKNGTYF